MQCDVHTCREILYMSKTNASTGNIDHAKETCSNRQHARQRRRRATVNPRPFLGFCTQDVVRFAFAAMSTEENKSAEDAQRYSQRIYVFAYRKDNR